ncbi:TonB-dependent receptor domain-containing protein [Guyparkeria sp.]|uniref:TonB-dependent receptor domain-containing protein n=1 Tax=Guyparkeria sp. TaxID=2035736 RepID=UPI003971092D
MTNRTSVRRPSLIAGLLCLTPLSAMADDERLGTINITAVREAPSVAPAMPQTVITREEIERSQARSLEDLLTGRAGLNVTNLGGPGKQSNVSIWGQSASRTAVFVDGMRIGSVSAGQSYLEHIPLAQVERIEIVRGPRSGQWGADAGGGVIQIFTREGAEDGVHLSGGIGAGSRGHREADAHVGGRQGAFDYSLGVAHQETDGFDAQSDPTTDPDDDGYERDSVQLQAGYRFGDGGHVRAHAIASSAEVEYDGDSDNSEIEQRTIGLSASTGRIGFWQLRARAGRHIDDQDSYKGELFFSRFDTQRDTLFVANDFFVDESTTVTLGADQTDDKVSADLPYTTEKYEEDSRRNQALFAQVNTAIGERLDVQGALRRDFNEQFGTANTGSLDLAYALTDAWTLTAGHGTAFTAPSFNLLYYPFGFGNPDLEPERTRTTRAGVDWQYGPYALELSAFRSKVRGFITPGENPENIERAEIDGAEIAGSLSLDDWQTGMALTYLSTEDEQSGDRLPRQPRWSGRLDVDRAIGAFTVGGTLRGQSDSEGGPWAEDNQGFVTADLRGAYRINTDWRIEARVENLFDRDYQVVRGYNQAPRGVFVSLRYGR